MMVLDLSKYTKELSKHLSKADNILLICHINPDGDAIGSQLALYHYLVAKGKKPGMISPNYFQDFLKWMDGIDKINIFIRDRKICKDLIYKSDLIIMVDFNQSSRLGEAENFILNSNAKKVIIDHHLNKNSFADLVISDPSKCSTSELLYELISVMNNGVFLNKAYSEAIYVGIITDTGNFEHGSYTGNTFRIIADLLDTGINKSNLFNLIFNNFSIDRMRLQGFSLNERMAVLPEFNTAYIFLTREDLLRYNYKKGDTEGFVNLPLSINGIHFSALFIEKDGFIKISFRSKGNFSVNEFAVNYFSGGGHLNAAGGEYYDSLENALKYFLKVLKKDARKILEKR
jgi:bifunctional oligoribonuclease and PAP phosphatase NrnA